jgi:hypothetical protein
MGWPKKDEGFRLYFERGAKTYLLVEISTPEDLKRERENGYFRTYFDGVGEILIHNNPDRPNLAPTQVSNMHIYKKCKRVEWSDMPEVWQQALAEWINGKPEDFRGLWKVRK